MMDDAKNYRRMVGGGNPGEEHQVPPADQVKTIPR